MDKVTVCVNDAKIDCKRSLLMEHSEYFSAMFNSNMVECHKDIITLKQVDSEAVKSLITFCETKEIIINNDNVTSLLETASMLQFPKVIALCTEYLLQHISSFNCLSLMNFAELHGFDKLYNIATKFSVWYASDIIKSLEFLSLTSDQLSKYLSCDELNVVDETLVFEAMKSWVNHNVNDRQEYIGELIQCLRTKHLSTQQLKHIMNDELIQLSQECQEYLQDTCSIKKEETERLEQVDNVPVSRFVNQVLWILPWLKSETTQTNQTKTSDIDVPKTQVCRLDMADSRTWSHITTAPWSGKKNGPAGYRACCIDCAMYVFGGELSLGSNCWLTDVWKYHIITEQWSKVTRMPVARRHHSLAVNGDNVYVIGGIGKYRIMLDTVNMYNTVTEEWSELPNLPQAVYCAASTVHKDKLYVIKHEIHCLSLENESNQWTKINIPLPFEVGLYNAISYKDDIYLTARYNVAVYKWDPDKTDDISIIGSFSDIKGWACLQKQWDVNTGRVSNLIVGVGNESAEAFDIATGEIKDSCNLIQHVTTDQCVVTVPDFPQYMLKH